MSKQNPLISIDINVRVHVNMFVPQRIAAAELFGQVGVVHKQDGEPKPWPQHRADGIWGRSAKSLTVLNPTLHGGYID